MKPPKKSPNASAPRKPLDARRFPLGAQEEATAGREKVREEAHRANVPRQSQRRSERKAKNG